MASAIKLAFFFFFLAAMTSQQQSSALSISDLVPAGLLAKESTGDKKETAVEANEDDEKDDEEESDRFHEITTKKPSSLHSFLSQSFGLGSNKPSNNKKPLQQLQEYLKPKPKPVVTATKTIMLEVTKLLTRHPVCIAATPGKPNCLPFKGVPNKPGYKEESEKEVGFDKDAEETEVWGDEYKNEGLYIEPTASVKMPADLQTASVDSEVENVEDTRSGRYLSFGRATPEMKSVKSAINEDEIELSDDLEAMARYLIRKAETKTVTRTIWATRVQKVTDYRVTATLMAQNCVPFDTSIRRCGQAVEPAPLLWRDDEKKSEENKATEKSEGVTEMP